jgi:hypothetical protein
VSGVVKAIVGVAVAVVGVVTGNPLLIAQGAMMTLGAVLPKPNAGNKATLGRLSKSLAPEDFRKIVFGRTAGATDLRYWETWGSDYTKFDEVLAIATHRITSYQELYIEEELVPLSGGSATGTYSGALQVNRSTTGGHIAAGGGTYWASTAAFTGVPHYVMRWTYTEKKLPQGIPSRYTQVVEGAPVYDPRRDSTRGGSGSHRANDQTTWEYSPLDSNNNPIGRNNALQMLWYLIGWRINNKLVAGRGVDLSDIDFAGFITAANDCEALEYYTDGILSTGDHHATNESILSADGLIGELLDAGGLWTYRVVHNDLADIAVVLTDDDVVEGGTVQWVPFKPMADKYNEVAGTYIDSRPTALFQPRAYPTVFDNAYYTEDNYKKRKTQNFQVVQSPELAQRLARISLNRARWQGEFSATFNLRALRARVWDIVQLSLERYGFVAKPFRVIRQSISAQGVELVLREEDASVYSNGTVTPQSAPSAGVAYDPRMEVALVSLAAAQYSATGADATQQDGLTVSWATAPGNVRRTEVQVKLTSDTYWQTFGPFMSDVVFANIFPLLSGSAYQVRARHISIHEVAGPWSQVSATTGTTSNVSYSALAAIAGGAETFRQTTPPTGSEGDYWTDIDNNNASYRHEGLGLFVYGTPITFNGNGTTIDAPWVSILDLSVVNALTQIAAANDNISQVLSSLAAIASDSILSMGEKAEMIRQYNVVLAEYPIIQARGSGMGISTELTAYMSAYSALTVYIGSLTSFSNTSVDTPINGTTFSGVFQTYYTAKQALTTKIDEVAAQTATWSNVTGTGRPADNATVGAPAGTNVGTIPATAVASTINSGGGVAPNNVNTAAIQTGAVTASRLSVSQLDAITATIGTLRTATTGARMEIADNVIRVYDAAGVLRVKLGNLAL